MKAPRAHWAITACQAAACVSLLAFAGCRVGPDYRRPAPPDGAEAPLTSVNVSAETPEPVPDAWWQLYQDPVLDRLLAAAFEANTDLAAAEANLSGARAVLAASRAGHYPVTEIAAGGVRGRDPVTDEILELGGHRPETIWLIDDAIEVAYEVDLFGRVRRNVEASRASTQAAVAARDSVKVIVAAETTRAYAQICSLGQQLTVARHSLDVVAHEADITARRQEAGAGSEFDVVRAQGLVAQIRSAIPPLEGQRRAALFQLTAVLGRTPMHAPVDVQACVTAPHLATLIPIGDGASLLRRRPDVRQAERNLAAATARIGVATADLYPRISLTGFYGGAATNLTDLGHEAGLIWGVGPSVSWAFPNQAIPRARVRQAKASAAAALASFDSVVLTALKETEQSLAIYSAALDNRQALSDAQDRAHRAFEMAHDQFLAGSVSNLDLLTSEQALVSADASVAASDAALAQDQIAVFKALGGGWQRSEAAPAH